MISQCLLVQEALKQVEYPGYIKLSSPSLVFLNAFCSLAFLIKKKKHSIVIFISLDFQIFQAFPLPPPAPHLPCLFSSLEKKLAAFQASAAQILPHIRPSHLFLMFLQQAHRPLKSVNQCLVIGTKALSVSMQHTQKGGAKEEEKKNPQTVKKGKKWDLLQWSLSNPASHLAPLFVGDLVTGLSLAQSTWWQPLSVLKEQNLEVGSDLERSSHPSFCL